jgi:hypothetical protein
MSELFENEKWKSVVKDSRYSPPKYRKYIQTVNNVIKETEDRIKSLDKCKEISKMSYEEWLVFQKGYKDE